MVFCRLGLNGSPPIFSEQVHIYILEVQGPSGPRLLGCGPSGPLDNVLYALRALRPCDQRISVLFFLSFFFKFCFCLRIVIFLFNFLLFLDFFSGPFDTSGSLIPIFVSEILQSGFFVTCTRTEEELCILVVGYHLI